ncbi:MAG: class I SAM-dependent methyltransferase [Alphaproteobacteria bacterium]|nr:class I SAM-dependent methyltransferase [Alphaproteobacteria bacterium]
MTTAPPDDPRLYFPATAKNRAPIRDALTEILPDSGLVLEVASGSGEHVAYFAPAFPSLEWQPTDRDPALFASIVAHCADGGAGNVRPPVRLDVTETPWPITRADAVIAVNLIHIAPWRAAEHLIEGAGAILSSGGPLVLYGPFQRGGRHTAPSNEAFDHALKRENPDWGVRDLDTVAAAADRCGLTLDRAIEMPANNLTVAFRKRG